MTQSPLFNSTLVTWHRRNPLSIPARSYLATVSAPFGLVRADNGCSEKSHAFISQLGGANSRRAAALLDPHLGSEAIDTGPDSLRGEFLSVLEHDCGNLQGWDRDFPARFDAFPELGHLSPWSPFPQVACGGIWEEQESTPATRGSGTIHTAEQNIRIQRLLCPTPSVRKIWTAETG